MSSGFIKNEDALSEDYRVEDLFDFSDFQTKLKRKVDKLSKPSIVAVVGKFGIGKSTMLYNLSQNATEDERWIQFDAWKYPDRKNLWEGFVLDFAEQIGERKKVIKQIDGSSAKSKWVDLATDIASGVIDIIPKEINFLDKFVNIFQKSPATRVFQLQEILKTLIQHTDKDLYIVVEDIDRSGDKGVFFLETLKQFLQSLSINKRLIVFVPISNESYYDRYESYLKSIDIFEFFEHRQFKLERFADELIDFSICDDINCKTQIISFLEQLFVQFPDMTPRKLKLILRRANIIFQNQVDDTKHPDMRVTICIEASKYFKVTNSDKTYFQLFVEKGKIKAGNIFNTLLLIILNKGAELTTRKYDETIDDYVSELITGRGAFKFITRQNDSIESYPSIPWKYDVWHDDRDDGLGITKFYIEY